jgi:branched-subunit amino acid transport protein
VTTWLVITAVGVGSYVLRALPVVLDARWLRAPRVEQAIAQAGTAALAALIAVGLRHSASSLTDTATVGVAATTALVVAVRGAPLHRVLIAGGAAYASAMAVACLLR